MDEERKLPYSFNQDSKKPDSILIAEDDYTLANALMNWLIRSGFSVYSVTSGLDAEKELNKNSYDLVLLDLALPDLEGREVLRRVRDGGDQIPIIIISARDGLTDKIAGLNSGADDYLTKPFEFGELEARIRVLLRKRTLRDIPVIVFGPIKIDKKKNLVWYNGDLLSLSQAEYRIIELLVLSAGEVLDRASIVETIEAEQGKISDSALDVYIHRIRKKLLDDSIQLKTIRGIGYRLTLS